MTPSIEIDPWRDFADSCGRDLAARGHHVVGYLDDQVVRLFLNAERLVIERVTRNVRRSSAFLCPPEHQEALAAIEEKIANGEDINPHRSKGNKDAGNLDDLLNHWGIYHLHLGLVIGDEGYTDRTGDLIFCRFDSTTAFLIGIYPHGVWTRQALMQTVHDNWPESIRPWRAHGLKGNGLTDNQVDLLRKRNANHVLEMSDGTIYLPPGGGVAAAGLNVLDVYGADLLKHWAREEQGRVVDGWDAIAEGAAKRGVVLPERPELRLATIGESFCAVEATSNYILHLRDPNHYR